MPIAFQTPRSKLIEGFKWLGERIPYPLHEDKRGDTYAMTWADDDEIYASAGDPSWGQKKEGGLDVEKFSGGPLDYRITRVNLMPAYNGYCGTGPKPTGMICVRGVLYLAFQNLLGFRPPVYGSMCQHGNDAQIICSKDHGLTWEPDIQTLKSPMFPGHLFGGPVFVNFGRNNEGAPDHLVYAVSGDQWDNGCQFRIGRVGCGEIMRADCWQWLTGWTRGGEPMWTFHLDKALPILNEERCLSAPDIVYLAGVKRYLLLSWWLNEDFSSRKGSGLVILEAPQPWGPYSVVHVENPWETVLECPYNPRIPLKWMEPDGITGWLQSSSWNLPTASDPKEKLLYRSHVRRFRLKMR